MSETKVKSASVKVMQSYNYCHFEASMSLENDEGLTMTDIDSARKDCQRLTDKAVKQYKAAKTHESRRATLASEKRLLESEVSSIKSRDESTWTVTDKAKIKALSDHNWNMQFDYEDEEDDYYSQYKVKGISQEI